MGRKVEWGIENAECRFFLLSSFYILHSFFFLSPRRLHPHMQTAGVLFLRIDQPSRSLIDPFVWRRRMASTKSGTTDTTRILSQPHAASESGMVSVTNMASMHEAVIRSIAGPDSTACVARTKTRRAPRSMTYLAAAVMVPAVSIMSSTRMTSQSSTSPVKPFTSETFGPERYLFTTPNPALSLSAYLTARTTPPASGATTTGLCSSYVSVSAAPKRCDA